MTKDLAACIHGLKKYDIENSRQKQIFPFFSVKEDMYLNTKDFINQVKITLNKKLNYAA
jgi:hypothetical protein